MTWLEANNEVKRINETTENAGTIEQNEDGSYYVEIMSTETGQILRTITSL